MTCYSFYTKIKYFKRLWLLSFAKNTGKNTGKNIIKNCRNKYSQEFLDHTKQSAADSL